MKGIKKSLFVLPAFMLCLGSAYNYEVKAEQVNVKNIDELKTQLNQCSTSDVIINLDSNITGDLEKDLNECNENSKITINGEGYEINGDFKLTNGNSKKVNVNLNNVTLNGEKLLDNNYAFILNARNLNLNKTLIKNFKTNENVSLLAARDINIKDDSMIENIEANANKIINASNKLTMNNSKVNNVNITFKDADAKMIQGYDVNLQNSTFDKLSVKGKGDQSVRKSRMLFANNTLNIDNIKVSNVEMIEENVPANYFVSILDGYNRTNIKNSTIENNTINTKSKNELITSYTLNIENTKINNNKVNSDGVSKENVIITAYGNVNIKDSELRDNTGGHHVIYASNRLAIQNSIVDNNKSLIEIATGAKAIDVQNSLFVENNRVNKGDSVKLLASNCKVESCLKVYNNTFVNNDLKNFFMGHSGKYVLPSHHNTFINEKEKIKLHHENMLFNNLVYGYEFNDLNSKNKLIDESENINNYFDKVYDDNNRLIAYNVKNDSKIIEDLVIQDNTKFISEIDYDTKEYRFDKDGKDRLNQDKYTNLYGADAIAKNSYVNTKTKIIANNKVEIYVPYNQDKVERLVDITIVENDNDLNSALDLEVENNDIVKATLAAQPRNFKETKLRLEGLKTGTSKVNLKLNDKNGDLVATKTIEVKVVKANVPTLSVDKNVNITIAHNQLNKKVNIKAVYNGLALDNSELIDCSSNAIVSCKDNKTSEKNIFNLELTALKAGKTSIDLSLFSDSKLVRKDRINVNVTKEKAPIKDTCSTIKKDSLNRIVEEKVCHKNGRLARIFTYTYKGSSKNYSKKDKKFYSTKQNKRLIKHEVYSNFLSNSNYRKAVVITKADNKANKTTSKIETTRFNNKKIKKQIKRAYFSNGNLKIYEFATYSSKGKRASLIIKNYFSNKRIKEVKTYTFFANGKSKKRVITKYFNNKKVMKQTKEITTYNKKGHKVKKLQYRYNKKGKLITNNKGMKAWRVRIDYKNNKAVRTRLNHYNAKGNLR